MSCCRFFIIGGQGFAARELKHVEILIEAFEIRVVIHVSKMDDTVAL